MAQTHIEWMSKKDYYLQIWRKVLNPDQYILLDPVLIHTSTAKQKHDNFDFEVHTLEKFRSNKYKFSAEKRSVWPIGYLYHGVNSTKVHWNVFVWNHQTKSLFRINPQSSYAYSNDIGRILKGKTMANKYLTFTLDCQERNNGNADSFCQTWIILAMDYIQQYESIDDLHEKLQLSVWNDFFHSKKKKDSHKLLLSWLWRTYGGLEWGDGWDNWLEYTKEEEKHLFGSFKGEFIWFPPPARNVSRMKTRSQTRPTKILKKTRSKTMCSTCANEWSTYKIHKTPFLKNRLQQIQKHAQSSLQ
jgi:hypothetical protein